MKSAISFSLIALTISTPALAEGNVTLERIDDATVLIERSQPEPAAIWLSADTVRDDGDRLVARENNDTQLRLAMPTSERSYVLLVDANGDQSVAAERVVPLERGSNMRDIGGYRTKDGHTVRWGEVYRSGAMPMLSEADYALLETLDIGSLIDLRALEEREVAPDLLDDRTGALFLSNDYLLKPLFEKMSASGGENMYAGLEKLLAPQFRMLFDRLRDEEGAVIYHCSAGQDRTGIATALIYDVLGVPRETILADYHLSTALRRPEFEFPAVNPADYPDNPIVQYYAAEAAEGPIKAKPLYTPSGQSHLEQFFVYLDNEYGGTEAYLKQELGVTDDDIVKLRARLLD